MVRIQPSSPSLVLRRAESDRESSCSFKVRLASNRQMKPNASLGLQKSSASVRMSLNGKGRKEGRKKGEGQRADHARTVLLQALKFRTHKKTTMTNGNHPPLSSQWRNDGFHCSQVFHSRLATTSFSHTTVSISMTEVSLPRRKTRSPAGVTLPKAVSQSCTCVASFAALTSCTKFCVFIVLVQTFQTRGVALNALRSCQLVVELMARQGPDARAISSNCFATGDCCLTKQ